jgi:phosphatidylglycerophosphate synthase
MRKKKIITIPNILTGFRMILAFSYLMVFIKVEIDEKRKILAGILILSAITDWLDGQLQESFTWSAS